MSVKSDKPNIINETNDHFNVLEKIKAIKEILKSDVFEYHNSVALYGDWGSGKSSVILTLIDGFKNDEDVITIKFDAWKYEKEGSLSYALLEHIIYELENNDLIFELPNLDGSLDLLDIIKVSLKTSYEGLGEIIDGIYFISGKTYKFEGGSFKTIFKISKRK